MSSAIHSPHPPSSSKQQWWSRPSASKASTVPPYRSLESPGSSASTTPTSRPSPLYDEKIARGSKPLKKFNTLASVIGFKSKKTHPTINIPSGPVSPPLPFQNPPTAPAPVCRDPLIRPLRPTRPVTSSSGDSSYLYDPKSPGEPSIYTYPSSEEAQEPITPSDQLSRHRTSYQPSLFTFAEQQDSSAVALRLGDGSGLRYSPSDARRISIMSDPSVIDPHMKRDQGIRSSRISGSSYYPSPPEQKGFPGRLSSGFVAHRDSSERRKSSGESRVSREIDLTVESDAKPDHGKSTELHPRDYRHHSDIPMPAVPKVSASMLVTGPRSAVHKSPSDEVGALKLPTSRAGSRTGSPVIANGHSLVHEEDRLGRDRLMSLRNMDSPKGSDYSPPPSARLPPMVRPKAASVSTGSLGSSGRPSPSIITSFTSATPLSRKASVASGTESFVGSVSNVVTRQQSISRLRAVPPSRNPPPKSNLPPTPHGRPPSPLTFRAPKSASASSISLLNSANSASDDPSILAFDLPPPTPSSQASSVSLCFAPSSQTTMFGDIETSPVSAIPRNHRDTRSTNSGHLYRQEVSSRRPVTSPVHTAKSSLSSNHTSMTAVGTRGDTPVQRSIRKSISQSSISFDKTGRGERQRVDSETSITSATLMSEENPATVFNSMRSLRKQRSMHNTRAAVGSLALPPLPQQLRHASSFNTASVSDVSGHSKGDSYSSPLGSQRRTANSSMSASTTTSIASTPTTPQTHKKRSIFSSHGRDRRDIGIVHERDKHDGVSWSVVDVNHSDKKKSHSIGLGIFSGHFPPQASSSYIPDVPGPEHSSNSRRASSPPTEAIDLYHPSSQLSGSSPARNVDHLDQHILPPKELLSQMEALADTEAPSSPPQFSETIDGEGDDDYWDGASVMTTDKQSMRSRVTSFGAPSLASGTDENGYISKMDPSSPPPSMATRHFSSTLSSIQGRLQNERPSTASRLPSRNVSGASSLFRGAVSSATRPSTADPLFTIRDGLSDGSNADGYCAPTGLPPPPRRKGAAISTPTTDRFEMDEPELGPLSPPPLRNPPARLQRLPSSENQSHGLQRLPSHETISSYNPNRGSIFRKPSFLNIDDELHEQANDRISVIGAMPMSTVPEDSFLILEHGKDSLDLGRTANDIKH